MTDQEILAHWYHLVDGLSHSPQAFYDLLEEAIERREIPQATHSRTTLPEGGMLSGKREYVRVRRGDQMMMICAAPFGAGFFVSWWLLREPGCMGCLAEVPLVGLVIRYFIRPFTYYALDTALMFQAAMHGAVLEVVDATTKEKGVRALSELERKPILRGLMGSGT